GIETRVTLEVESYLKGALGGTVQFLVPGGSLGRFRSIVVAAPEFAVDERVVVFLGARGPGIPYVVGFNQGVYRVVRSGDGSALIVTPPAMLPSVGGTTAIVRGDPNRRPLPLPDFEQRVRVRAGGARCPARCSQRGPSSFAEGFGEPPSPWRRRFSAATPGLKGPPCD